MMTGTVTTGPSAVGGVQLLNDLILPRPNQVLERIRGSLYLENNTGAGLATGAVGIVEIPGDLNPTDAGVPDAIGDAEAPFIWWHPYAVQGTVARGPAFVRIEIDSKARRRLTADSELVMVIENQVVQVSWWFGVRILLSGSG